MPKNIIGEKIKKYRMMRNYSQIELAAALDVAPSAIAAYESGNRTPKIELREQIARELEVDPVELSGIELTTEDEIRLLNKLMVKYCDGMNKCDDGSIDVKFSEDYTNLYEVYSKYREEYDNDKEDFVDESAAEFFSRFEKYEMEYWLECWPNYDYVHAGKNSDREPEVYLSDGFKELVKREMQMEFLKYEDKYLSSTPEYKGYKKITRGKKE